MSLKILGVKVDRISKEELLEMIKDLLIDNNQQEQIVTTNPEFIIAAQKDDEFKKIINNSWISIADGYGIKLASKYLDLNQKPLNGSEIKDSPSLRHPERSEGSHNILKKFLIGLKIAWWGISRNEKKLDIIKNIITGTDLVVDICKIQNANIKMQNYGIFLLGGFVDVPEKTAKILSQKFSNLNINYSVFEEDNIIQKINDSEAKVLFVALNHPKAQKWIANNLSKMPSVKLAMGVGGAFDYISGEIKRAQGSWLYSFEWLYRLIKQPKRIKRIYNAVIKFPWLVFSS